MSTEAQIYVPNMWQFGPQPDVILADFYSFFLVRTFSYMFWKGFLLYFFSSLIFFSFPFTLKKEKEKKK